MTKLQTRKEVLVSMFLRVGLAAVFFYAAVSSLISPQNWIGFFPGFLRYSTILLLFSIYEIVLGIWLLSNWKVFYPAVLSAVTLFIIVALNIPLMDVVFRDVAIFFMAVALAVLSKK